LVISKFKADDEAVKLANEVIYKLAGGVSSGDMNRAR
jgi:acyl-CoA reductase-like NAD-dependent aldehyde dehydrogenase